MQWVGDYVGISTIRYEFVSADSITSQTYSSVLATGGSHSCAILENGSAMCWELDNYGQLGDGRDRQLEQTHFIPFRLMKAEP